MVVLLAIMKAGSQRATSTDDREDADKTTRPTAEAAEADTEAQAIADIKGIYFNPNLGDVRLRRAEW